MKEDFDRQIRNLALTLRPCSIAAYQVAGRSFLRYLAASHPGIHSPSQLRRDPHILGYMRILYEKRPPLKSSTRRQYLIYLRHLLIASDCDPHLIGPADLPRLDEYLPRSVSPEDDCLLDQELRKEPDLMHSGLLLLRATGMRIGECVSLSTDCLRHLGQNHWALRVPLGKLHSERWIPVNDEICRLIAHILSLRPPLASVAEAPLQALLFPLPYRHLYRCELLRRALTSAARRAGCSTHISPHQLRHTFATEMVRAGMSLPALKEILGHKSIRMTMRYISITQIDLQQQYLEARRKIATHHVIPRLPIRPKSIPQSADLGVVLAELITARHIMEMYRRRCPQQLGKKLNRLTNRLSAIAKKLSSLHSD